LATEPAPAPIAQGTPHGDFLAFISYRHACQRELAERIESGIHDRPRSWFERPAEIFRDEKYLLPTSDLPGEIAAALARSRHLILLASPEAAASQWVLDELRLWCASAERIDRLILILADGELPYDTATKRIDWSRTTALPAEAEAWFQHIPLYLDARGLHPPFDSEQDAASLLGIIEPLCARLNGMTSNEYRRKELAAYRRNLGVAAGVGVLLSVLLTAAVVLYESAQRSEAKAVGALEAAIRSEKDARNSEREAQVERGRAEWERDNATIDRVLAEFAEGDAQQSATEALTQRAAADAARVETQRLARDAFADQLASHAAELADIRPGWAGLMAATAWQASPTERNFGRWLRTLIAVDQRARPTAIVSDLHVGSRPPLGSATLRQTFSLIGHGVHVAGLDRSGQLLLGDLDSELATRRRPTHIIGFRSDGEKTTLWLTEAAELFLLAPDGRETLRAPLPPGVNPRGPFHQGPTSVFQIVGEGPSARVVGLIGPSSDVAWTALASHCSLDEETGAAPQGSDVICLERTTRWWTVTASSATEHSWTAPAAGQPQGPLIVEGVFDETLPMGRPLPALTNRFLYAYTADSQLPVRVPFSPEHGIRQISGGVAWRNGDGDVWVVRPPPLTDGGAAFDHLALRSRDIEGEGWAIDAAGDVAATIGSGSLVVQSRHLKEPYPRHDSCVVADIGVGTPTDLAVRPSDGAIGMATWSAGQGGSTVLGSLTSGAHCPTWRVVGAVRPNPIRPDHRHADPTTPFDHLSTWGSTLIAYDRMRLVAVEDLGDPGAALLTARPPLDTFEVGPGGRVAAIAMGRLYLAPGLSFPNLPALGRDVAWTSNRLWVITDAGIVRTSPDLQRWEPVLGPSGLTRIVGSPSGVLLAVDTGGSLWRADDRSFTLVGSTGGRVVDLAIDKTGRRALVALEDSRVDGRVQLWSLAEPLLLAEWGTDVPEAVEFGPDGDILTISSFGAAALSRFPMTFEAMAAWTCDRWAPGSKPPDEWATLSAMGVDPLRCEGGTSLGRPP
jgi:hypothetical protein